jgi:type I restriction enzyme S subunit
MSKLVLEQVPKNWTTVRIREIAQLMYGKALRADKRASEGCIPVYGSSGLVGQHNEALHSGPSLIIGRKGTVGSIYLTEQPFWAIDTTFYLAKINPVVNFEFLAYMLRLIDLSRLSMAVAVPGIRRQDIESEKIPLPPLPEQHRIVAILRQADELRRWRNKTKEKVQMLLPALFYKMFGNQAAQGWRAIKLEKVIVDPNGIRTGPFGTKLAKSDYDSSGVPLWGIKHVNAHFKIPTDEFLSVEKAADLEAYALEARDVVMTRKGTVGNCAVYPSHLSPGIMHSDLLRLRPDHSRCLPEFLVAQLTFSPLVEQQMSRLSTGTVMLGIQVTQLKQLELYLPPIELQREFIALFQSIQAKVDQLNQSSLEIGSLFQSLLTRVFTGELTARWRLQHRHELREAAAQRDTILGRVRQATLDLTDEVTYNKFAREVAGLTSEAVRELLYVLNNLSSLDFSRQWQFLALVEQIQKGLPEYVEQVNRILYAVVANINHELQIKLAQEYDSLASQTSETLKEVDLNDKAGFHVALALALAAAALQAQKEADGRTDAALQRWRTVRSHLDKNTQALLRVVEGRPAYFRPAELVASHQQLDLVTAQESLHLLTALGFVRPVRLQGERVYRVVNPDTEKAATISESS